MYHKGGRPTNYNAIVISSQHMLRIVTGEKKDRVDMLMYTSPSPLSIVII